MRRGGLYSERARNCKQKVVKDIRPQIDFQIQTTND
jgi:hypothetical protein